MGGLYFRLEAHDGPLHPFRRSHTMLEGMGLFAKYIDSRVTIAKCTQLSCSARMRCLKLTSMFRLVGKVDAQHGVA